MKTDKMLDSCDHSSSTSSGMGSEDSATMATSHGQQNGRSHAGHRPNPFQKRPFLIGVAGGTSSGKSTVCSKIMEKLGIVDSASPYLTHEKRVICISQDSFYRKLTEAEQAAAKVGNFNFDHPTAFDSKRLTRTIRDILKGKMVKVPVYNYKDNQIGDEEEVVYPADVVLVEGLLLFYFPEVRELFHMKVFVDTDMDTRLSRRVIRDVNYRQRDLNWVLDQYMKFVKPSFEEFCLPTKKYADIIVPRGPDNEVAVGLIVNQVESIFDPSIRHKSIKLDSDEEEEDVSSYYDEYSSYGSMGYANGYTGNGMSRTISRLENVHNYRRLNEFAAIIPEDVSNCVINGKCLTPTVLNGAQFTAAYKSAKAQQRQRSGASLCSEPQVRQSDRSETPELLFGDDDELDVELECDGDDTEDDEGEDSLGSSNRSNPIKIVRNLRAAGAPQKLAVAAVNNLWSSSAPSDLHSTLTATVNSTPILINGFSEAVDIQYSSSNDSSDDAEIAEDALSQEEELGRAPNASASGAAITNKINLLKIH